MSVSVSLRIPSLGLPRPNVTNQTAKILDPISARNMAIASITALSSQPQHNHVIDT